MSRLLLTAAYLTALAALALPLPALAQGAPQTLSMTKIDPASLATGYRTSKVVGAIVVNEAKEKIGTVDDLIVTKDDTVPYAVLSVGGFLGVGTRYVVVPANLLVVQNGQMTLTGASKDSLKALPEFTYAK
ncbi:PRC-barrel domain-containing protein [Pleomorphomonas sp. PLEO]|uniref:PRC-barrel domain-containing protein n=1 Tax=Pleomorphomonas sp. PLEO TaxID=3239306 RepID=UPI00351F24E7